MSAGRGPADPPQRTSGVMLKTTRVRASNWSRTSFQNAVFKLSHRVRPGLSSAASLITTLLISFDQEVLNQHLNLVTPEYPFFESPWATPSHSLRSTLPTRCRFFLETPHAIRAKAAPLLPCPLDQPHRSLAAKFDPVIFHGPLKRPERLRRDLVAGLKSTHGLR